MADQGLLAGAHQVDITPTLGTLINGEFQTRYANKIHDALYVKCLVLRNESRTLVFVVVDICAMQQDFLDDCKKEIQDKTGLSRTSVMIASTHTHSAGSITDLLMGHVDQAYRTKVHKAVVQVVVETLGKIKPAKISFGAIDAPEHVLCRRYRMHCDYAPFNPVTGGVDAVKTNPFGVEDLILEPNSIPDSQLAYLAVKGLDNEWISLLANYSLHYVGDMERGTISADYFGYFAQILKEKLAPEGDFVGILTNGTSGEINIWDFINGDRYPSESHRKSAYIAADLVQKLLPSLATLEWEMQPSLEALYEELPMGLRKPSAAEFEKALELLTKTDYERVSLDKQGYQQIYAREQVLLMDFPDVHLFRIQSFRIGTGTIGALGGEFFAETGLALKKAASSGKYFTVCFANDYVGYVPPQHEIALGGYETWRCRTSFLQEDAEEIIRAKLIEQIKQMQG